MAVTPAYEKPDSPTGNFEHGKYSVTRKFIVQSNTISDGPIIVTAAIGVPRLYEFYAFGNELQTYVRCRSVAAERITDGSLSWMVTAEYSTPEPKDFGREGTGQEVEGQFENPLLELAQVSFGSECVQVPVYGVFDPSTGTVMVCKNSAGQTYVPPPMMDQDRLTLTITRNEIITAPHPQTALTFQNTCNSDTWWGASAGQVKCKTIVSAREVKNLPSGSPFPYLKVTYVFNFLNSWDLSILDSGDYYQTVTMGPLIPFQDQSGNTITGLLDGSGNALASGGTPVFNSFRVYARNPFAALNLPQSYASGVQ